MEEALSALKQKPSDKFKTPAQIHRAARGATENIAVIVDLRSRRGKWCRHIHIQDLKPAPDTNINIQENEIEEETLTNTDADDTDDNRDNDENNDTEQNRGDNSHTEEENDDNGEN